MSRSYAPIDGVPTSAQARALNALLGEGGALERAAVQKHIPLGFVLRSLVSAAFRLCWLYEAGHVELFDAVGTMASCEPEIEDPASFADHLQIAFDIFASGKYRDVDGGARTPSSPPVVERFRLTGQAVVS